MRRQVGARGVHLAHHFLVLAVVVDAGLELDDGAADATLGGGGELLQVVEFAEAVLERIDDELLHVLRTGAGLHGDHDEDGDRDVGILGARNRPHRMDAERHQQREDDECELRPRDGGFGDLHGGAATG